MLSIFIAWCLIALLMFGAWGIYLKINNPGIIDVFWPIAIALAALVYSTQSHANPSKLIFQCLLLAWALRLALYLLLSRIMKQHIEKRYVQMSESWSMPTHRAFAINFQCQGLFALIIACPFLFISSLNHFGVWQWLASALIVIGIIGEYTADRQLQRSKRQHPGQVCTAGLWRYSRHPNCFFDWLTWLGFGISVLSVPYGFIGLLSPALLLFIMARITIPITEKGSMQSKGKQFIDYQRSTSMFFPWLSKR